MFLSNYSCTWVGHAEQFPCSKFSVAAFDSFENSDYHETRKEEPWTPYRLIQAFIAAGCPKEAFGFYPTDHEGAGDILKHCGRALIFGDKSTTDLYAGDPGSKFMVLDLAKF